MVRCEADRTSRSCPEVNLTCPVAKVNLTCPAVNVTELESHFQNKKEGNFTRFVIKEKEKDRGNGFLYVLVGLSGLPGWVAGFVSLRRRKSTGKLSPASSTGSTDFELDNDAICAARAAAPSICG